jgi:hypothetical protein
MVVYLLHEYVDDLHGVLAIYQSRDAAIASCKAIALQRNLIVESSVDTTGVTIEYSDKSYCNLVWVDSMGVIEDVQTV